MSRVTAKVPGTLLGILATLGLLFAFATPVAAAVEHCPDKDNPGKVESSTGDFTEQDVHFQWSGDPGTVTVTNNNDVETATVVLCLKGGNDFEGGDNTTGSFEVELAPGEVFTDTYGTEISYFILYSVELTTPPPPPIGVLFSVVPCPAGTTGPSQVQIEALEGAVLAGQRLFLNGQEEFYDGNGRLEVDPGTYDYVITEPDGVTVLAEGTVEVDECSTTVNPPNEGEEGGNPAPNEGTLGGNPVPDTAMAPTQTGSLPAALVALLMLAGLGVAGYVARAEVVRRR